MTLIYFSVFAALPIVLWILYRIVMQLKIQRDALKPAVLPLKTKLWGYPVLIVGYTLDFAVNMTYCVLLFWELPKELTVSARVKRLCASGSPNRKFIAMKIRDVLLKPYDPSGGHD